MVNNYYIINRLTHKDFNISTKKSRHIIKL